MLTLLVVAWTLVAGGATSDCNFSWHNLSETVDTAAYSCHGRCGVPAKDFQPCRCDAHCLVYSDCCEDVAEACPDLEVRTQAPAVEQNATGTDLDSDLATARLLNAEAVPRDKGSTGRGRVVSPAPGDADCKVGRARLISKCPVPLVLPEHPVAYGGRLVRAAELRERCELSWMESFDVDVPQVMPVTDRETGHHFLNVYCLLCHGGSPRDALPWSVGLVWDVKKVMPGLIPQSVEETIDLARRFQFSSTAFPPDGVTARRCLPRDHFDAKSCSCSELSERCRTARDAYMMANYVLHRNPHCVSCVFADTGLSWAVLQVPAVQDLIDLRNSFQFFVELSWMSDPVNSTNSLLTISLPERRQYVRETFPWKRINCTITSDQASFAVDTGRRNESDATTTEAAIAKKSGGADLTGEFQARSGLQVEGATGQESGKVGADGDAQRLVGEAKTTCEQVECSNAQLLLVAGVCRRDMERTVLRVRITCVESRANPVPLSRLRSLGPKTRMMQGSDDLKRSLSFDLQSRLLEIDDSITVSSLNVLWDEERCYWSVSAGAVFAKRSSLVSHKQQPSATDLSSCMYSATTQALSRQLANTSHGLLVCAWVQEKLPSNTEEPLGDTLCALSSFIWPRTGSFNSSGRCVVSSFCVVCLAQLLARLLLSLCKV